VVIDGFYGSDLLGNLRVHARFGCAAASG